MARAGLFREQVTFQRMATTTDDYGNVTAALWSNIVSRNAELTERTGFKNDEQGAPQDVAIAQMKVRSDMQIQVAEIRTEVKIQFREVFTRVKRLEAIMIGASASIIAMLVMVLTRMP